MIVDGLGTSDILRRARVLREVFDVNNLEHLKSLKQFLTTGNWGKIQFFVEAPYITVTETVMRKVALSAVSHIEVQ